MKKILSLTLAVLMVVSMIPTAFAAETQDYSLGTAVNLVGDGGEYTVTVPATLELGQTGAVTAKGYWKSYETLTVSAPEQIEVTNAKTSETTKLDVNFAGIQSAGNDLGEMNVPVDISIDDSSIIFGEWIGIIEYNVELMRTDFITFTINGLEFQAYEDMTWAEWCDSKYNTDGQGAKMYEVDTESGYIRYKYGSGVVKLDGELPISTTQIISGAAYNT